DGRDAAVGEPQVGADADDPAVLFGLGDRAGEPDVVLAGSDLERTGLEVDAGGAFGDRVRDDLGRRGQARRGGRCRLVTGFRRRRLAASAAATGDGDD